ncbi:hypothetical protein CPAR01_03113 [Colletotrichum paranaense]|uniref:Heterokaryon incompatibility domain-containing protein n=1 Tax=Colletotrichum paranaense TaxID=1914294 RepID=A0ABQ9T1F2_9PEZI|nr:uncharacterized protein CPAR01_03113 [Colletotrichum paranaense]KAK1545611.1 hypothetical protein CPAR01_03113 [Colletotrichum paranaense]
MTDPGLPSLSEVQDAMHHLDKNGPGARPLFQDPARQIRLFTLWPGTQESPIQGVFSVATLDDGPDYLCISYVWGDASDTKNIAVDGKDFKITTSLFSVLRRIRSEQEYLTVWADALCINQDDHEEKRVQVDMMFDIYSKCNNCFLWLGEVDLLDGELSLDIARYGLNYIEFFDDTDLEREDNGFSTAEGLMKIDLTFRSLVKCQWWRRIWTVQECVAPHTAMFLWGPLTISRSSLIKFRENFWNVKPAGCEWATYSYKGNSEAMFTVLSTAQPLSMSRTLVKSGPQTTMSGVASLSFLWMTCDHQALDPRDKIFALLPFITAALTNTNSSNYNIDCVEVYSRVTVDLIQSCRSLLPLMGRRQSEMPLEGPSWVLDWRRQQAAQHREPLPFIRTLGFSSEFNASRGIPELHYKDLVSSDGRRLRLRGYFVGTIVRTIMSPAEVSSGPRHRFDYSYTLRNLIKTWKRHVEEDAFSEFRRLDRPLFTKEAIAEFSEMWNDMEKARECLLDFSAPEEFGMKKKVMMLLMWLQSRVMNIFLTCGGRFGVGTHDTKEGDEVWILCSGFMPLVLRPIKNNSEQGNNNGDVDDSATFALSGRG